MLQLSVNQLTTMRWSMAEDATFFAENGISSIGLTRNKVDDFGIEKTKELLSEMGLSVSSYGTVGFSSELAGPTLADQIFHANQSIQLAAELTAKCLIVHTGGTGMHLKKNRFNLAKRVIDSILPVAEEHGVKLAIEPLSRDPQSRKSYSHNFSDSFELVESYSSTQLGLNLDTLHVGNDLFKCPPELIDGHVFQIQLTDYFVRNGRRFRCNFGNGDLLINDWLRFIDQSQNVRTIEIEMWGEEFDYSPYDETVCKSVQMIQNLAGRRLLYKNPSESKPIGVETPVGTYKE